MGLVIGLLTLVLVLTSAFLILLILVQLPKKEAGLGMAFGGATTEALFGAGSGTVLSRLTKYSCGIFIALAMLLSILRNHEAKAASRGLRKELENKAAAAALATPVAPAPLVSNLTLPSLPALPAASPNTSAAPAAPVTRPAAEAPAK